MSGVVVGTGRSASSAGAVLWAVETGLLRGVPVTLLHAWQEPVEVEIGMTGGAGPPGWTRSRVVTGNAGAALLSAGADLLVLGLAGGAVRLPSVVRMVLHQASVPVVVVPQGWSPSEGPVVVGLCGTDASASARGGPPARLATGGSTWWRCTPGTLRRPACENGRPLPSPSVVRHRVQGWVAEALGAQQVALRTPHGPRLEALLDAASGAALLVLGSGTHSTLERLLHGRVADDVVTLSRCAVAVVPDPLTAQRHRGTPARRTGTDERRDV